MKNTVSKQAGNVIEWVILGIVLIGVVALIAWRYTDTDKDQNNADQANNSSQVLTKSDTLKIADWKVEIKQTDAYGTLAATPYTTDNGVAMMLTSSKLAKGTYTCTDNAEHKDLLGRLEQSTTQDELHPVKVGDKYYGFISALQNTCFKETDLNILGKGFARDLPTLLTETK